MRLLYFADTRFPLERANGIQTFETCHALARLGHEVTLVVRADTRTPPRDPFAFYDAPRLDRLRIVSLGLRGTPAMRRAAYLGMALTLTTYREGDVVFTRDLGVASAVLHLPRSLRLPIIYESHGLAATVGAQLGELLSTGRNASSRKQARLARREQRVWRAAEGYVTITAALATQLERLFGPRDRVAVVPDGARVDRDACYRHPPPHPPFVAAYAGHLYPWKGVDVFVRALAEAHDVHGLIVGGHPAEPDLARVQALVSDTGVAARVEFTGLLPHADVAHRIANAHALVMPNLETAISSSFSSPLKLFEYLAAGRPIIAADLPAFREVLTEGENALLVPAGDHAALAAALRLVRNDVVLAERLGRAGLACAGNYTWDRRAERVAELARTLVTSASSGE